MAATQVDLGAAFSNQPDDVPGAQALLKGLDVLLVIGSATGPMRFRDIEAAMNMPRASLHRLLAALVSRAVIKYDPRKREYELGMRVLELSRRSLDRNEVIRAAKPELARLARQLQRTICLMVLDRHDVFVLDFEDADPSYGRLVRLWPRQRILESAAGRSILSAMPREKTIALVKEIANGADFPARTMAEFDIGKALGYAVTPREAAHRKSGTAAAILDEHGFPVAALSCLFESDQVPIEDLHRAGRLLHEGARRASRQIRVGHDLPTFAPRPDAADDARVTVLPTGRDYVGENPLWDARNNRLYWVDVLAPALRWLDLGTRQAKRVELPNVTAGLALEGTGHLVSSGQAGFHRIDPEAGAMSALVDPEADKPDNRFNTAGVDSHGRLWAGSMALDHRSGLGALYSIDRQLTVTRHAVRCGLPKNPVFSRSGRIMYIADGADQCIRAYACDPETGQISDERDFVVARDDAGRPNGMTIDAEDHLWVAWFGGWALRRFDPEGKLVDVVNLPVPMPTGCAFGGRDLKTLYVTTTYIRMPPGLTAHAPAAGQLLAVQCGTSGMPPRACFR